MVNTGNTYDKVAPKLFYKRFFHVRQNINMFHENKTQGLHIVWCLFQFNWDDTIRNQIALDLWDFATQNNIWLSVTHLLSVSNYRTDNASI